MRRALNSGVVISCVGYALRVFAHFAHQALRNPSPYTCGLSFALNAA